MNHPPDPVIEYRPLSKKQAAELRGYVSAGPVIGRAVLFFAAVTTVGFALRGVFRIASSALPVLSHFIWWIAPTVLVAWFLYRKASRWTGGRAFRSQVRRDLSRGELAIRRVEVSDAIAFDEVEDCGPCYVLLTTSGTTLLFDGQYLEAFVRRGFPWTSFEIHEAPESQVFFGIHGAGERFKPSARFPAMSFAERKALGTFNKPYQVVDVDFASLKSRTP